GCEEKWQRDGDMSEKEMSSRNARMENRTEKEDARSHCFMIRAARDTELRHGVKTFFSSEKITIL
ncbi:hypothetical protein Bpfe_012442, partial [Biomphalaria pfeifferi]